MNPQGHQSGGGGHERRDADVISLALIAALLLLVIALCLLVCFGFLHRLNRASATRESPPARQRATAATFPPPQLITQPGKKLREGQLAAQTKLQTYGWVDRQAGVARIPIAEAMKLLLERGLPEVGGGQTRLQLLQSRPETDLQPNEPSTAPPPEATP